MSKQIINVAFIGGGKGCYDILHLLKSYSPVHLKPHIIGVADINNEAIGMRHAKRLDIPTTSDYKPFLHDKNLDLIIELTGDDNVLANIRNNKLDSIKILDHVGAAAIGEISYRLTHELRNPLMIIGGLVRRMMTNVELPHGSRKKLKHISHHVQHIEELISDICDVVRPLKQHYSLVNMKEFLGQWVNAVKAEAHLIGVTVDTFMDDELPTMYIDHSLVRQALWHILENSLDAMVDTGGSIKIKALLCWDNIHIEIIDSGIGFSELSTSQSMQPFMTTKIGKMGLGLALCRQIILDHGGDLKIVNEKNNGTTVIIKLPITLTQPS
jgi:signal transduction histidine kinase